MAQEHFQEEQWFPSFVGVLVAGASAATAIALLVARSIQPTWVRRLLGTSGTLLGVLAAVAPMRTMVTDDAVMVTFGLPSWIRFRIAIDGIQSVEPVTYRPLAEFGGWGIRFGRDGTNAYTARGNRGVRIEKAHRRYLIGSQRPEELAEAIRRRLTAQKSA